VSKIHTVRSGDTLGEIAKRYNTTVSQLAKANRIANPNKIQVGQKIVVDGFEAAGGKPSSGSRSYTVKSGDTLGEIASRFGTTVSKLASANRIANPNKISVGQKLVIPGKDGFEAKPPAGPAPSRPPPSQGPSAPAGGASGPVRDDDGRTFPTSRDGTPMFRQGDPQWGSRRLGTGSSLSAAGCAMTSMAMAVSKITGKVINPGEMDAHLDANGGYSGNALVWGAAAKMGGLGATKSAWSLNTINQQIDAGRPVVIGVDYKAGSNGGANGTDHWIAVTGRGKDAQGNQVYYANDPATGKQVTLHASGGRLVGGNNYKSTGELVVLTGGNPRPGGAPPAGPSTPSAPPAAGGSLKGVTLPAGDLEKGARGEDVKQLQTALVKLGHMTQAQMNTGPGIFGDQTQAALKKFQAANGIEPVAGYYGPKTRAVMEKLGGKVEAGGPVTGPAPTGGGAASDVSLQDLKAIMPALSDARAREVLPHLNRAMAEAGINTKQRQAMFLAQLGHESASFRYFEEIASGSAYEGRADLGNTQPGDGVRFKGRGPIQLTGRSNYRAAGRALGIDLENNPRRAADLDVGFRTAAWFWNSRSLNTYADQGNFREVTRRINGGYNGLADREAYYRRALAVL
jgi:predicted chitinase/LysM repeat protein